MAVAINNLNHYPYAPGPIPFLIPHQTLRVGREAYLNSDHSARMYYARGGTHTTHVVWKGRVSWCIGATLRHGRKIGSPFA